MNPHAPAQIVILGGGFGGRYAAIELERAQSRRGDLEMTLVNRENFFLFTPMLDLVFSGDLVQLHTPRSRAVSSASAHPVQQKGA